MVRAQVQGMVRLRDLTEGAVFLFLDDDRRWEVNAHFTSFGSTIVRLKGGDTDTTTLDWNTQVVPV